MRHLLPAAIFMTCLFAGYQAGVFLGLVSRDEPRQAIPVAQNLPAVTSEVLPNGQRGVVWIVADNLASTTPRLEGIWFLSYVANSTPLTFLPIFPTLSEKAAERAQSLVDSFFWSKNGRMSQLDAAFLDRLRENIPWWGGYIVIDRTAFSHLGSVEIDRLPHAWEDPRGALLGQAAIYQEICWSVSRGGEGLTLEQTLYRLPGHLISDMLGEELLDELAGLSEQMSLYSCEFPTLALLGSTRSK